MWTDKDEKVACVLWEDKGLVKYITTVGSTATVDIQRRQCLKVNPSKARKGKHILRRSIDFFGPYIAALYAENFHGVDRHDQLRSGRYGLTANFSAQKWTMKFVYVLLDLCLGNAWILFCQKFPHWRKNGHSKFMNTVADEILAKHALKVKSINSAALTNTGSHSPRKIASSKGGYPGQERASKK